MGVAGNTRCLLGAASLAVIAMLQVATPMPAFAQARESAINVPRMPMAQAIDQIRAQSGVAIAVDPDTVKGLTSHPVRDATSARAALQQAMRGLNVAILPGADGGLSVVGDIVVTARRDEAETNVLVRQASTSDRTGLSLREQPRNTQVISAKTIEEQQGLSVVDALQNAGGVTAQANNYAGNPSYTVRGFYAAGLVNGLPGGAAQPIANVERVEILKGPDAILSGFGSLGGNINVVTKKPSAEERLTASMDAGSLGLVRGVIDANNAINADKTLSGRVVASAQTMDHNFGGYLGDKNWLFAPSLRYKDRLTDIFVSVSLGSATNGLPAYTLFDNKTRRLVDRDPSVPIFRPDQGIWTDSQRYYIDVTRQIVPGLELVMRGSHENRNVTAYTAYLGYSRRGTLLLDYGGSQRLNSTNGFDGFLRMKKRIADNLKANLIVGYNYGDSTDRQRSSNQDPTIVNPPLGANTTVPIVPYGQMTDILYRAFSKQQGVYGQALLEVWKFKLLGGVRRSWFDSQTTYFPLTSRQYPGNHKGGTSPSFGAIFDATRNLSLFANFVRGEQVVLTVNRNGSVLPNIFTTNKEAGAKLDLFDKRATINASYFDILQSNVILRDPRDPLNFLLGPGQRGRGIDLNISGQLLPGWTVLGSFTRTNYVLLTKDSFQTAVARQPRDVYSLYTSYRTRLSDGVSGGVGAGLYGRSSSYADTLGQYVVPAARQVNLNGFLSVGGFDLNIGIRNLFDRRNYSPASTIGFIPVEEPRNVRLTLSKRLF